MAIPISNAKDTLLNQNSGTLPNMSDALLDWFQKMTFTRIVKNIVNFQVVETPTNTDFQGVWQPSSPQALLMKSEGQRQWKWFTVHADPSLHLDPDEIITYLGTQYRVMNKLDYTEYAYIEYELIQDYTGSGPPTP